MHPSIEKDAIHYIIVGVGGIGSNLAIALAQMYVGNVKFDGKSEIKSITIIDFDVVEEKNLNRLPFKKSVGELKVEALKEYIANQVGEVPLISYATRWEDVGNNVLNDIKETNETALVVDCTDNTAVQRNIFLDVVSHQRDNLIYAHIGNENEQVSIEINRSLVAEANWGNDFAGYLSTQTNSFFVAKTISIFHDLWTMYLMTPIRELAFDTNKHGTILTIDGKTYSKHAIAYYNHYIPEEKNENKKSL